MKERPILFSAPMVRAILDGRKTQTRRIVKPQPTITDNGCPRWGTYSGKRMYMVPRRAGGGSAVTMTDLIGEYCPYGQPGDRLWVRETWAKWANKNRVAQYRCDVPDDRQHLYTWTPSIFMPRWASRITLEITGVRVQRVQEISELDCEAEIGATAHSLGDSAYMFFTALWNEINAKRGYGWDSNPWVWALTFRRTV